MCVSSGGRAGPAVVRGDGEGLVERDEGVLTEQVSSFSRSISSLGKSILNRSLSPFPRAEGTPRETFRVQALPRTWEEQGLGRAASQGANAEHTFGPSFSEPADF